MTLQEKLDDARAVYHQLLTGRIPRAYVDQNGERIEYTAANRGQLYLYIQGLEVQLGVTTPTTGPAGFMF